MRVVGIRDKKIAEIGRFFGEKLDFGGPGKDFAVEKSGKKISKKSPIFPIKTDFSWKFFFFDFFPDSKNMQKIASDGFEPTQNAWKWHPPTTKPLMTLIIYNANFFYILLLFICS